MAELERKRLHAFLSAKARRGKTVTLKEVATHFDVTEGAAGKCLSLLTGSCVLVTTGKTEFDCARVPSLTVTEFESAASQGKTNTAYVHGLWKTINQLKKDNETMRGRLLAAKERLTSTEGKP